MKLILDEVAIVERKDVMFIRVFPNYVLEEINIHESFRDGLEIFYRYDSIYFWSLMDAVFDYRDLKKVSKGALEKRAIRIKAKINAMARDYLNATESHRKTLDRNVERRREQKNLKYMYETLQDYISNPEKYDEMFSRFLRK